MIHRSRYRSIPTARALTFACLLALCVAPAWAQDLSDLQAPEEEAPVEVKRQLAEQFCAILNGGCAYSGRDMKETHAALAIDKADFNALVEDLQIAMDRRDIPFRAQNKLLSVLAPMHREVITR